MIYQIKLTLEGTKPPIWRRIEISKDTKLSDLHDIIQITMGWMDGHLHQFSIDQHYYCPPTEFNDFGNDYTNLRIDQFFKSEGATMKYEYDFGDSWLHRLKLEKIKPKEDGVKYPRCTKGKRACPPEDCGGVWGYEELQEIMKNPKHPEYQDKYEWLQEELEPETFDIDEVNTELRTQNYSV